MQHAKFPLLHLECGQSLYDIEVAYQTYGVLNPQRDNAILICHALTGDADAMEWWNGLIGPGKTIDTNQYFVICSNILGGCYGTTGPSSINLETGKPYGLSFPMVTIRDMVTVQRMLIHSFHIQKLHAVIGGSMGGMQALEWSIMYPEDVTHCILIATATHLSTIGIAYNDVARKAIMSDPDWCEGDYYSGEGPQNGLAIARMLGMLKYGTAEIYEEKFGRNLVEECKHELSFNSTYQVESYLRYQGEKLVRRFDANCYLYLLKALDTHNICRNRGSIEDVLQSVKSKFLIIGINSDLFYPCQEHRSLTEQLKSLEKTAVYKELDSPYGHDAFLIEMEKLSQFITPILKTAENVLC